MVDKLKIVGTTRPPQLPELQHRNEMDALNANRRDDHRACFRLPQLLPYLRGQIHDWGDQYSTPKAVGTASLPRCLGRIREGTQPHLCAALPAGGADNPGSTSDSRT